jgi:PAS domain-containing protein
MPIIYSFNETYEWSALVGILLFAFVGINTSMSILPVLSDSRKFLYKEIALRGKQYAAEVDRFNNIHLREKNLDRVYTGFLEGDEAEGVQSYRLFDTEGRIYRPISELNTIISGDSFAVDALNFYKVDKNQDSDLIRDLGHNTIGIARAIKATDRNLGRDVVVAIITIRFSPSTLVREASYNYEAYLETLMTSGMVAIIFFGLLYYMTVRPLEEMRIQTELVLRGRQKELTSKGLFKEISPLRNTINSILSRIRELQQDETQDIMEVEDDAPYIRTLQEFMAGAQGPVVILNSDKVIQNINPLAEDLLGIRENSASGTAIGETTIDRGLAANLIELCDKCANNQGYNEKMNFEVKGRETEINVNALIGTRDKFAKGFYITFVQER